MEMNRDIILPLSLSASFHCRFRFGTPKSSKTNTLRGDGADPWEEQTPHEASLKDKWDEKMERSSEVVARKAAGVRRGASMQVTPGHLRQEVRILFVTEFWDVV